MKTPLRSVLRTVLVSVFAGFLIGGVSAQIVVSPSSEAPRELKLPLDIPLAQADMLLAAARANMREETRASLPDTNAFQLVHIVLVRDDEAWRGVLTYRPR